MAAAAPGLLAGTLLLVISADGFRLGAGLFDMTPAASPLFPSFAPVRLLKKGLALGQPPH